MSHRKARLNVRDRELLVERVCEQGWAVAHAAKAQGVSRQCAHRWINRFRQEGHDGLQERSSRPHYCPRQTSVEVEEAIVATRRQERRGQDWIGPELDVPARTVCRVLRRHGVPYLRECDPLTGEVIRASKTTAVRYERERPGELTHVDVKKIGKILWEAHRSDHSRWRCFCWGGRRHDQEDAMSAEGVAVVKYRVTAKHWRNGWELHIEGVGVTQVRLLADAAQQAADYIETLRGIEVPSADIAVTPELDDHALLNEAAAARAEVRDAEEALRDAARHQREIARRLRRDERLSVSDTATVMKVSRGRVSQLTSN